MTNLQAVDCSVSKYTVLPYYSINKILSRLSTPTESYYKVSHLYQRQNYPDTKHTINSVCQSKQNRENKYDSE